ncbi:hypothetical protein ACGF13_36020 [Kitasatospora sp. NPDC048286]|uniref:hypothetical protein n=1 Tax=Kitasatospora sp. NPDC048286 TaxID=3364047 RepID=UPI003714E0AB
MTGAHLSQESIPEFLERFLGFEDGVITNISIFLPRGDRAARTIEVEVQALDRTSQGEGGANSRLFGWKLVRIAMRGMTEYRLAESLAYPLQVLSDGLKIGYEDGLFTLDLDPGPDEWSARSIHDAANSYSKQYILSRDCSFEVLDGPFI